MKNKIFASRTVIGIICIVIAIGTCFGIAPLVNKISDGKTEIVRVKETIIKGSAITENDIELIKVGSYNLPDDVIKEKNQVVGKYATSDLYIGEYLLPSKLTDSQASAQGLLDTLDGTKLAMSVSISSFASGLSGKLQTGDIVSLIVHSAKEGTAFTPDELMYVKVITTTNSQGVDKENIVDKTQPTTITLLVNRQQAQKLAEYERTATIHFSLVYRGNSEYANNFLTEQDAYFNEGGGDNE